MTTNNETWLANEITGLRDDEVEIDGMIFAVGKTNAADYIGQEYRYIAMKTKQKTAGKLLMLHQPRKTML